MNASPDESLRRRAIELVRAAYDAADKMRHVDLAALNETRPPTLRYHAQYEIVREFIARANGMLELAGRLGLIGSAQDAELRKEPTELDKWLEEEDKRLSDPDAKSDACCH